MSTRGSRACILAVGTEVTSGQISNGNAAWLSERLTDLGLDVVLHETVPDDRPLVRDALKHCAEVGAYLFVTGGLGPTTDDFTRELIAEWVGKPVHFHEPSWKHIADRLGALGVPVVESQRQQCVYPEGAEVFRNEVGTANAFYVLKQGDTSASTHAWILPGPPREIQWLWDHAIRAHLAARVPSHEPVRLLRWHCVGRSEAELGEAVERVLAGTYLKTGYRFQRPYVEVKVWCPEARLDECAPVFARLETELGASLVAKNGADIVEDLLGGLAIASEIEIYDNLSGGILAERLGRWLRESRHTEIAGALTLNTEWVTPSSPVEWVRGILSSPDRPGGDNPEALMLAAAGFTGTGEWAVGLRLGDRVQSETLSLPYRAASATADSLERSRRYATEIAIVHWARYLRRTVS